MMTLVHRHVPNVVQAGGNQIWVPRHASNVQKDIIVKAWALPNVSHGIVVVPNYPFLGDFRLTSLVIHAMYQYSGVGSYNAVNASVGCTSCIQGSVQPLIAQTFCEICQPGGYSPSIAQASWYVIQFISS
jgi:hypothetical protein